MLVRAQILPPPLPSPLEVLSPLSKFDIPPSCPSRACPRECFEATTEAVLYTRFERSGDVQEPEFSTSE